MNIIKNYLGSSVGKKQLVGLSGLGLSGFVLMHMSANLLIIFNPRAYNEYSHTLVSNPLLPLAELALVGVFLLHVVLAMQLAFQNKRARPVSPAKSPSGDKAARFGSRSMIYTGLLTLVFLVLHLITFKYGPYYSINYDGVEMRDMHRLVVEKFHEVLYVAWYIFALLLLGLHLSHGFGAFFQSLGWSSVRRAWVKNLGYGFAALIAFGFIVQPLYVFFGGH